MSWRMRLLAAWLIGGFTLAGTAHAARKDLAGFVPFDQVRSKLAHAKGATVATVCGTTVAPWAYRGPRGDSLELKARTRTEQGEEWARDFATTLMVEAN